MAPYIVCFLLTCTTTFISSYYKKRGRRVEFWFFSLIAILLPCILAALRANTVGTDMLIYGERLFKTSQNHSFFDFVIDRDKEWLYYFLVYISSHVFKNIQFQYFFIELLSFAPIYLTLMRDKESNRYAWLGLWIYFFWLFPYSLNLMRQSIAISIIFWAFKFVEQKCLIKYIICVLLASMFHVTALIGIIIYPLYFIVTYSKENIDNRYNLSDNKNVRFWKIAKKFGRYIPWLVAIAAVVLLFQYAQLVTFLNNFDSESFGTYYEHMTHKTGLPIIRNYVLIALPIFVLYVLNRKYYENSDKQLRACFTFSLISIILYQAAMISSQTYRISLYMHIFWPLFIIKYISKTKPAKTRLLYICLVMVLSVLFWYIFFVKSGWCEIIPYVMR